MLELFVRCGDDGIAWAARMARVEDCAIPSANGARRPCVVVGGATDLIGAVTDAPCLGIERSGDGRYIKMTLISHGGRARVVRRAERRSVSVMRAVPAKTSMNSVAASQIGRETRHVQRALGRVPLSPG